MPVNSKFPHYSRLVFALAVLAVILIATWTLAAPQSKNQRTKIHRDGRIQSRSARAPLNTQSVRKLGLITGYSSPGIFILDPDTNTVSGPVLSGQINPANISCAVITQDGMTGVVASQGYARNSNGYDRFALILYFIDLSDRNTPVLLGTASHFFSRSLADLCRAGHLCLAPGGKYVMVSGKDYFGGEFFGWVITFHVSSRTEITAPGGFGTGLSSSSPPPCAFIAPDGETVVVTRLGDGFGPSHLPVYRLGPSGQLSSQSAISPFTYTWVASFSPDGRTLIVGTIPFNVPGALSILRLDSPCNLVVTGNLSNFIFPSSIAFAPDGKKAYVLVMNGLRVLNVKSPGVVEDSGLVLPGAGLTTTDHDSLAIDPQGRYAYVGGPVISVVDLKTNSLVGTIATGAKSISFSNPILADVGLTKSVDNLYPVLNDIVSFTVTAINNGPRVATGVLVSDRLPDGLSYVSQATNGGSYNPASGLWNIGSLEQGDSAVLTIKAKADKIGTMTNTVSLQAINQVDPEPANDAASANVESDVRPDFTNPLLNYESVDRISARAGQTLTFTIGYGNTGGRAVGVVIANPSDIRLENVQPLDGGMISEGKITWNLGKVAANAGGTVRFKADVKKGVPRGMKIVSQASIVSNQTSPVVTNMVFVTIL